ncbi:MAG: PAS domain S-box protein [Fibrobacter sp.]|jgi:PAS domain S-box-containing protein|nr:PAS domain S-box protein [Fibrobacter sp.]
MSISAEEARFIARSITGTVHEALIVLDRDLRAVSASSSFYRQFKLSAEQTEGCLIYQLNNCQWDIPALRELLESVIHTRKAVSNYKFHHVFESIGEKSMLMNASYLLAEKDEESLIVLAIDDITERIATREKLLQSELKYQKFVEELNSIIISFDRRGRITFFNHFSEKVFGYSREEAIGMPFVGTIIPCVDSAGQDNSNICEKIFTEPGKYYENESEGICKDGRRIWFSWSASAVIDKEDIVTEVLIDGNDITNLKRKCREAEENASILKALLNFIPEGIIITDSNNMTRQISRYMGEIFGIPSEWLLNTDAKRRLELLNLYWPNRKKIESPKELPLSTVLTTGETFTDLEIMSRQNGTEKFLSLSAAPVLSNKGEILGVVGSWRDITENRQMNETVAYLAKLPEEDPNPVLRVTPDGLILYANKASKKVLANMQCHINSRIPDRWQQAVSEAFITGTFKALDTRCEGRILSLNIVPVTEQGYVNIYASDITRSRKAEEKLSFERERLKIILDNLHVGVILMDNKGTLSTFNKVVLNWYGYSSESEMFRHSSDYANDFDLRDTNNNKIPLENWPAQRAVNKDYVKDLEIKLTRIKTGVCRWISFTTVPIINSHGEITHILMSMVDITKSKMADEALRQSERLLNSVIDTLPVGIVMADANGKITRINETTRKILDLPQDEQEWQQYSKLVGWWPDTGKQIEAEEWALVRALNNGEEVRNELVMNKKFGTGEFRYYLNNATPLRNAEDRIIGALVAILDITERLKAEKKLQKVLAQAEEGRNILSALMKNIPLGIVVADAPDVKIRIVSEYGQKLLDRSSKEITGISVSEHPSKLGFCHADGTPGKPDEIPLTRATIKGEIVSNEEWFLINKEGIPIPILCNAGPIRDEEGNIVGGVIGWSDITEQRKASEAMKRYAEELASVNRDLESFSYSVSHDLRNPLSVIGGLVDILIEDYSERLDEPGKDYLWRIDKSIKTMKQLINDILSLSRVGRQEIRKVKVDLSDIVRDFLTELKTTEPQRQTEFVIEDNLYANADPRLIHLALENLLLNAWKFTSTKKLTRIEFGTTIKDGNPVYFISDNGVGFDSRYARKIFEPFQRIHAQKQFEGTGVGLSIVQKVILRHGGKVWAEGEVGKGATFFFTLK